MFTCSWASSRKWPSNAYISSDHIQERNHSRKWLAPVIWTPINFRLPGVSTHESCHCMAPKSKTQWCFIKRLQTEEKQNNIKYKIITEKF